MEKIEDRLKYKSAQINNALGVFILFFGVVVLIGMFFTDTRVDHITDAIAGSVLCLIGGGMILKAQKTMKTIRNK